MTPILNHFHAVGIVATLVDGVVNLIGFDALPADRAERALAYARAHKNEIVTDLEAMEASFSVLLDLARYDGLRFWFSGDGLQGAPIHALGQFEFGLITRLWMTASPLQYQRYDELLKAQTLFESEHSGVRANGSCWWRQ